MNRYIAMNILMYVHGCNRKFYNTYLLSYPSNKKKVNVCVREHRNINLPNQP
jgi:hypothetical protein